jgi:hypothetical protein
MTERTAMRVLMVQDRFWWVFGFEFVIADRVVPVREQPWYLTGSHVRKQ